MNPKNSDVCEKSIVYNLPHMSKDEKTKSSSRALTPYKPKPLAIPDSNSDLDAFIRAANQAPILTPEREKELAHRLRKDGDMEAAKELILSHLRLVISIARQYLGYGLPFSDLVQEGNIGLMKAVKRFDPEHGARLVTFAMTWIRSEIQEYVIRNWRLVRVATTKSQRRLFFNLRSMKEDAKALNTHEINEIAEKLEVKPSDVVEMEKRMGGAEVAIDEPGSPDGEGTAPADWLYEEKDEPVAQIEMEHKEELLSEGLKSAVQRLDPRSRRIIEARWLFDESDGSKGATLAELAEEFHVSQERIRQIEKKALQQLKDYLK
jgi:RNA polymerase sigma-32 factor